MMITIMRVFPAYDIKKLLDTPFAHVRVLFGYASTAADLNKYDYAIGIAANHDGNLMKQLEVVNNHISNPDRRRMKELTSKENIKSRFNQALHIGGG